MTATTAHARLMEERKQFRKSRPFGFVAKPATKPDGSIDLMKWECSIPGPVGTSWEGGQYPLTMTFPDSYPVAPPVCAFPPGFFHINVYPAGTVCLSILNADDEMGGQWAPSLSVRQVLLGIQELLTTPNILSPAQKEAAEVYKKDPARYEKTIREQAKKYPPPGDQD